MRTVRPTVFETNSSSAHCVTFLNKKELDAFRDRSLVYDMYEEKLVPASEMYPRFMEMVNDSVLKGEAPEDEVRALTPTQEVFVTWINSWDNVLKGVSVMQADDAAVSCIRRNLRYLHSEAEFLVSGFCEDQVKQKGDEDLFALSLYREN
ncbi:hypothetical protein [Fibrobacter sp.]|uniref:hypothetical protein n=1 Tax=Fibrobacter sp. TaxID=35828 RepID=UPI0038693E27